MGTNYYVKTKQKQLVDGWMQPIILHIGKSSYGWYFSLHIIPQYGLNELEDWKNFLKGKVIHDEYGRVISYNKMIKTIVRDFNEKKGLWGMKKDYQYGLVIDQSFGYKTCVGKYGLHYVIGTDRELGKDGCYTLVKGEFC